MEVALLVDKDKSRVELLRIMCKTHRSKQGSKEEAIVEGLLDHRNIVNIVVLVVLCELLHNMIVGLRLSSPSP